jgi:hypothetical protein
MKHHLILLCLLAAVPASHAQRLFTTGTATELITPGAFDAGPADDLAVLDRASGVLRIGTWNGSTMAWTSASSGVEHAEYLCAGMLTGAGSPMSLAAGSSLAQQLEVYTPSSGDHYSLGGFGVLPTACVVRSLDGSPDDFLVASSGIFDPGTGLSAFLNQGTALPPALSGNSSAGPLRSGNPVSQGAAFLAGDSLEIWGYRPGMIGRIAAVSGLPAGTRYAPGQFGTTGGDSFMLWVPGQSDFRHASLGPDNTFLPAASWDAGLPIGSLQAVGSPVITSDDWLLAISQDGTTAALFDFTPAGGPVLRQHFTALAGLPFTAASAQGSGHFMLLNGASGRTSGWQRARFNGTNHTLSANALLPNLQPSRVSPTLFLYSGEPWVVPSAMLLGTRDAGDWTTSVMPPDVHTLMDQGAPAGLGRPDRLPLFGIGAFFTQPNQISPAISIGALGPAPAVVRPVPQFSPPPGIYRTHRYTVQPDPAGPVIVEAPLTITLSALGSTAIRWRLNGGPWQDYSPEHPPSFNQNAVLEAYASIRDGQGAPTGAPAGPMAQGVYTFGPLPGLTPAAFTDADGNGLSDSWEKATGLHDPGGDKDADGFTNLQEQNAGSDPCDPGSLPPPGTGPGVPELFLTGTESIPPGVKLRLTGLPGVMHRVESASVVSSNGWTVVIAPFAMPPSGFLDFTVSYGANQRQFFRGIAER